MDAENASSSSPLEYHVDPDRADEIMTPRFVLWIANWGGESSGVFGKIFQGLTRGVSLILFPIGFILRLPLLILIQIYKRLVSPFLPPACRFEPTCSVYTYHALQSHGFLKGSLLGFFRILRCQPMCSGGYDPVPEQKKGLD
ncbi:MAG: membrane protein insertion efficiency factor YidD [Planctomycetota bacterium]|nr:membrane protein insertion efficiency factor YidD [Planctomycetota bacterium]